MFDLLTIGGIAAVIVVVCAACFAIYKMLSRDDTFDEVYPNDALKFLTSDNKENTNNKNKAKNKRHHHPRRPKGEAANTSEQKQEAEKSELKEKKEIAAEFDQLRNKLMESHQLKESNEKLTESMDQLNDKPAQQIEQIQEKMAGIQSESEALQAQEEKNVAENYEEKLIVDKCILTSDNKENTNNKNKAKNKRHHQPEKGEAAANTGEQKQEAEKLEKLEKEKKEIAAELDKFRAENEQLTKENREQKDRHVVFEQTVRNKLMETHQLKEANKKLTESMGQMNEKAAQQIQQMQQKIFGIQSEALQAQEERNLAKNYAEKLMADMRKAQEEMRDIQISFNLQNQVIQVELNKERDHRIKVEQDFNVAKQMIDKMAGDLASKENAIRETDQFRAVYENKLQALQNELNREKDTSQGWKNAGSAAETQIAEMNCELEKAMAAYQNLKTQQGTESEILAEMVAMNQKLEEELGRERATQSQNSKEIDELKSSIDDQRARNNDLRQANFKLHETIIKLETESEEKKAQLVNGVAGKQQENGPAMANENGEHDQQIERLTTENKQYKQTLDNLNKQLEEVSQIARDMEREKDAKIAQIEAKLTNLLDREP